MTWIDCNTHTLCTCVPKAGHLQIVRLLHCVTRVVFHPFGLLKGPLWGDEKHDCGHPQRDTEDISRGLSGCNAVVKMDKMVVTNSSLQLYKLTSYFSSINSDVICLLKLLLKLVNNSKAKDKGNHAP